MGAALPDLGFLAAAGVLLLIAAALWVLIYLIQQSFGRLPVVGGWISANIGGALSDARNWILGAFDATWDALTAFNVWIGNYAWRMFFGVTDTLAAAATAVDHIAHSQVPAALSRAESLAISLYNAGIHFTSEVEAWAGSLIASGVADARAYAGQLYADAIGYTARVETWAGSLIASGVADAKAYAGSLFGAATTYTGQAVASAEATLTGAIDGVRAGVYTDLQTWGDGAVALAWPGSAGDIAGLDRVLGADFPWLKDLEQVLAGAGAAGLAGALIRSLAGTQAITKLAEECIVPNCRNLSGFGSELHNLLGVAGDAALLAFLVTAVADPAGWAADMAATALPVGQAIVGEGTRLLRAA